MNTMKYVLSLACAAVLGFGAAAADGKATFRDAQGRKQGSSTTDRYGKTTYRDAQGRIQGSKK